MEKTKEEFEAYKAFYHIFAADDEDADGMIDENFVCNKIFNHKMPGIWVFDKEVCRSD